VQAEAETHDTGAEAAKPDPRCSWQGHSRRGVAGVGDESMEPRSARKPLGVLLVIRPERRTCVAVVR